MSSVRRADEFVPELIGHYAAVTIGDEVVAWSPHHPEPVVLDPVAAVLSTVVDGQATMAELAREVHEEVGVGLDLAETQVARVIDLFDRAGLLTSSAAHQSAAEAIAHRSLHTHPASYCSDKTSRSRGMRSVNLRFGDQGVRVACASRRGERLLRRALADHVVADEQPLGFIVQKQRQRAGSFQLLDRAGVELATSPDLEPVLGSLAGHLAAFAAPAPREGSVRVRVAVLASESGYVACVAPLLYVPTPDRTALAERGLATVDRFTLDLTADGGAAVAEVPWPALQRLPLANGHRWASPQGRLAAVAVAGEAGRPSPARAVAELARTALSGTPVSVLTTLQGALAGAQLVSASPLAPDDLPNRLGEQVSSGEVPVVS